MNSTPRLGLPYLSAGQAQKEIVHNEALQTLDSLVAATVEEPPRAAPPADPAVGVCYLVADAPTGDWSGYAQCVAGFTDAGWRFIPPREGITCYVRSTGSRAAYRDGGWEIGQVRGSALVLGDQQVVGLRAPAIAAASGGTIVDIEARVVIDQILAMLRQHGLIEP